MAGLSWMRFAGLQVSWMEVVGGLASSKESLCVCKKPREETFFFFNLIYIHAHVCVCGYMCIYRNRLVFALYLWQELTILFLLLLFFFKLCL